MHIHASSMNINAASFYSATGEEKAADVRKKLMKSASDMEGASSPDETFLVGQWLDSRHSQVESASQHPTAASGKDSDFG